MSSESLPVGLEPYGTIRFCSNTLVGGAVILSVGEVRPLLIAKGPQPLVWLKAVSDVKKKTFVPVVEASVSINSKMRIVDIDGELIISLGSKKILSIKRLAEDEVAINYIDFRPIGINLHGNDKSLNAGGMTFSGNTFSGGGVFIGFSL